ncbi:unnamed protein product, partial [Dovyalis caffra]
IDLHAENDHHLHQLDDGIAFFQVSLKEAHEKSNSLTKEVAEYRFEEQASVIRMEELEQILIWLFSLP